MDFKVLQQAVHKQLSKMAEGNLFRVNVTGDKLWDIYLNSFPEGTNPIYKERTEHDCNCCKNFIRACGNVVSVVDNKLVSIWDVEVPGEPAYQEVVDVLAKAVKRKSISSVFLREEKDLGAKVTRQMLDDGGVKSWNHFFFKLPNRFVKPGTLHSIISEKTSSVQVFTRALDEISQEVVETVLELIDQGSIYRGEEHKKALTSFLHEKVAYDKLTSGKKRNCFCWVRGVELGAVARIRNTAIGTLLVDLSKGVELDVAVKSFETKVAPSNYKRPTALVTKSMIRKAQEKVEELGLVSALPRRHAKIDDITINNVLWADRSAKEAMNVFDELVADVKQDPKTFSKVEEVYIDNFMSEILPTADTIELQVENRHESNLMSLIAPVNKDVERLFKWNNNFSWAYNGEVADSMMKKQVKLAGGKVDGVLRFSIMWNNVNGDYNNDDFDAHCVEPSGNRICFSNKENRKTSGFLDVDIITPKRNVPAVENITWTDINKMREGKYKFQVHNYSHCNGETGFTAEIEYGGVIHKFAYDKALRDGEYVDVAELTFSKEEGIKFLKKLPSTETTKNIWGLNTNRFHKVRTVMYSPNHWDGEETGNRHWFFIMEGCDNPGKVRGFFNEFLKEELNRHRKVFEVLGGKMKAEVSDEQLSGLGFSSTKRNSVLVRVTGKSQRVIKLVF